MVNSCETESQKNTIHSPISQIFKIEVESIIFQTKKHESSLVVYAFIETHMVSISPKVSQKMAKKMASGLGGCMLHNTHYDFNDAILSLGASYWVQLAKNILQ